MLTPAAALVRRADPDRFLTSLFAPAIRRPVLLTLYAFNHELARAPEVTSEPTLALIRLQWWREVIEGARRSHEIAAPLAEAISAGALHPPDLLSMIEAREQEVSPDFRTLDDWRDWLLHGAGSVAVAAGRLLGATEATLPDLRTLGAGYGAAGVLRSVPIAARQGRSLIPAGIMPSDPALAASGLALLGQPRTWPPGVIAAALPAVLARRDLRHTLSASPRGIADRLALTAAALLRRA